MKVGGKSMNNKQMPKFRSMRKKCNLYSLTTLIVTILLVAEFYVTRQRLRPWEKHKQTKSSDDKRSLSRCNLFSGKWVYDNTSEPQYKDTRCSFMDQGMACEKFGRKNLNYKYWKWQPHDCELPRFNPVAMLEKLRNKRLVYVGDSLNRNQWVSMVCLVESLIPETLKSVHFNGSLVTFKAIEYNASIDFYWAPLLVESNCDNPDIHRVSERVVRIQEIEKHAKHWSNADVLVFNSYIWWRRPKFKVFSDGVYEEVEMLRGYEMALKTWSDWLDIHVNRTKTKLFFVSSSPTHNRAEEWGNAANRNCYNETEPILKEGFWGVDSDPRMMRLVEADIDELSEKGLKVQMLNITQISEYRKDAHSSIYRKHWDPLSKEQLENPSSYADCTHWCLPGVPDVWNQFLYTYLLHF